jgi:Heat shock protein
MTILHRLAYTTAAVLLLVTGWHGNARAAAGLEGQDWQLRQYRTDAGLRAVADTGNVPVLRFEDGRVGGNVGCNRLLGGYTRDGDRLRMQPNMASTMMGCPPPLMAQEQAVATALMQVAGYRVSDDELLLTDADGVTLLTFTALTGAPNPNVPALGR